MGSFVEILLDEDIVMCFVICCSRWDDLSWKFDLSMWCYYFILEVVWLDICVNNKFLNGWILVEKLVMKIFLL